MQHDQLQKITKGPKFILLANLDPFQFFAQDKKNPRSFCETKKKCKLNLADETAQLELNSRVLRLKVLP